MTIVKMPKFKTGQSVHVIGNLYMTTAKGGFTIERLLPEEKGEFQYRIKSKEDGHSRVVREFEIT